MLGYCSNAFIYCHFSGKSRPLMENRMDVENARLRIEGESSLLREAIERTDRAACLAQYLEAGNKLIDGIDTAAMELSLTLLQTTEMMNYDLESAAIRKFGFSNASFHLAFVVALSQTIEGAKLPIVTNMSRATVSNITKTLEKNGIVKKEPHPTDGRGMMLSITPEGFSKVIGAWAVVNKRERKWAEALTPAERERLIKLLRKLSSRDDGQIKRRG